jgi:hypothetical protein
LSDHWPLRVAAELDRTTAVTFDHNPDSLPRPPRRGGAGPAA